MVRKEILRMYQIKCHEDVLETVHSAAINLFEGECVGLVGNNDSGMRNFMGAITGEFSCSSGYVWIAERRLNITSIEQARKEGVFLIKYTTSLIDEFSIMDTLKLNYAFVVGKMRFRQYIKRGKKILELLGIYENYDTLIHNLRYHQRILLEIALAISCDAKILVLDNAVSFFSATSLPHMKEIFHIIKSLGISIVFLEVQPSSLLQIVDRMYIMRRGRTVAVLGKEEMNMELILSLIEGQKVILEDKKFNTFQPADSSSKIMEFNGVWSNDKVIRDLSFCLFEGEILGLYNRNRHSSQGLEDIFSGNSNVISGNIEFRNQIFPCGSVLPFNQKGIFILTENDELFSNMTLEENLEIAALKKKAHGGIIKKECELKYMVQEIIGEYISDETDMYLPGLRIPDSVLIRKKAVLCRAILAEPEVLIFSNPFSRMDIKERKIFSRDIIKTKCMKISQIIISSELEMLYPICDRIIRIENGKAVEQLQKTGTSYVRAV